MERRDDSERITRLEERFITLREAQIDMRSSIEKLSDRLEPVLDALTEAKGGWKVLMGISTVAATVGGAIGWLLSHLGIK